MQIPPNSLQLHSPEVAPLPRATAKAQPELPSAESKAEPPQRLDHAVERIQTFVAPLSSDLQFLIDNDSGESVVKVIDRATKDVIRQIPSEEALQIARALDRLQGLLVRQQA